LYFKSGGHCGASCRKYCILKVEDIAALRTFLLCSTAGLKSTDLRPGVFPSLPFPAVRQYRAAFSVSCQARETLTIPPAPHRQVGLTIIGNAEVFRIADFIYPPFPAPAEVQNAADDSAALFFISLLPVTLDIRPLTFDSKNGVEILRGWWHNAFACPLC
jgi:hypothetical protein